MEQNVKTKFYKEKIIDIMTFLFGPVAGGLLVSINYLHMGRKRAALFTMTISFVLTLLAMYLLSYLPDGRLVVLQRMLIPGLSVLVFGFLVYKTQKDRLDEHARNDGVFYSAWRALGISLIGLVILLFFVLILSLMQVGNVWPEELDHYEEKAMKVYEMIERDEDPRVVSAYVDSVSIVNWKKYQDVLQTVEHSGGLAKEDSVQLFFLKKYVDLRLQECSQMLIWMKNPMIPDEELNRIQENIGTIMDEFEKTISGMSKFR